MCVSSVQVSARQIVNVLGRWKSNSDWNAGGGRKGKLDDLRSGDYYEDDLQMLKTDFSKPMEYYIARRPQFLNFCDRYGLVARWVHGENVAALPFTDEKLAASVGATVAELNAEPIDPLAAEVVFDALSGSAAGFVLEEVCDEKRASFVTADGGFDGAAFSSALGSTRRNLAGVLIFGPGIGLLAALLITIHWLPEIIAGSEQFVARLERNLDAGGPAVLVLPALVIAAYGARALNFTPAFEREGEAALGLQGSILESGGSISNNSPRDAAGEAADGEAGSVPRGPGGRALSWQEMAVLKQDELFLEEMVRKKRGTAEEEEAYPIMSDDVVKEYYQKQWQQGIKAIFPFLK